MHAESFTSVCENCLHKPNERTVKETIQQKARAVTDKVLSALCSCKFRTEPVIFTERTKRYMLGINVEKTRSCNGVHINEI